MRSAVVFEAVREGYSIEQLDRPMTVGELKALLEYYDDEALFILSHDNGYTYGSIRNGVDMEEVEGEYGPEFVEV